MAFRTCSAVACTARISMGAAFCAHHWSMVPSDLQMTIAGLSARARKSMAEAEAVQHRLMYALLQARQAVAKAERRGQQPIAFAYRYKAEEEGRAESMKRGIAA